MLNYSVISKEAISNSKVAKLIKEKEETEELTYREDKIREYFKKFSKIDEKKFDEAFKEITELEIPRLENEHIIKIIDIMPKNGTELRAIVTHSGTVLVDENVDKVLDVLKKYQ